MEAKINIALMVVNFLVFLITCVFNGLAGAGPNAVFHHSTSNISDKYNLQITPAGWTFSIWGFIYAYMAIWILFSFVTIRIKTYGGYLYYCPALLPPSLFITYTVNLACNTAWLILWDREEMETALVVITLMAVTSYISIGLQMRSVQKNARDLIRQGLRRYVYLAIGLVINGIGLYAAWLTIATLLNLGIVLCYFVGIENQIASSIALGVLAFVFLVYSWMDLSLFEKQFRYFYTPYLTLFMALAGILAENWDTSNPNTIFTVALLCCGIFVFIVKVITSIVRSINDPLYDFAELNEKANLNMSTSPSKSSLVLRQGP